ncbi:MAG: hypothetical protein CBB97_00500 [Candidatus Endolissoclinum sp. TMED37]|nr:MAG: hypothetical protein CBB97_00500 [Candidatus Endolissoclinum sp. TMED37]|tara:strand:+ start:4134 stop:4415 length:282 start_codon:yes stop_codon:yes gene_type:complete
MKNVHKKFNVGELVVLRRIFTPDMSTNGTNYTTENCPIIVEVVRVQNTSSLGNCYELKCPKNTYLGGVMYWENDIQKLVSDDEEEFWKMWGDI